MKEPTLEEKLEAHRKWLASYKDIPIFEQNEEMRKAIIDIEIEICYIQNEIHQNSIVFQPQKKEV